MPDSFVFPEDRAALLAAAHARPGPWIIKPASSCQGKGITIVSDPASAPRLNSSRPGGAAQHAAVSENTLVVERYIERPLLLHGRKFDLRLYVAVTSVVPLRVYRHCEGLVRVATELYPDPDDPNPGFDSASFAYSHLTNYSINKKNPHAVEGDCAGGSSSSGGGGGDGDGEDDDSVENRGNGGGACDRRLKLSLAELHVRLVEAGVDPTAVWASIDDMIIKTLLTAVPRLAAAHRQFSPRADSCFELFGFDVLLDEHAQPWLMEVNFAPSLGTCSDLDFRVKVHCSCSFLSYLPSFLFQCLNCLLTVPRDTVLAALSSS
jgi:hypothetical protein